MLHLPVSKIKKKGVLLQKKRGNLSYYHLCLQSFHFPEFNDILGQKSELFFPR